MKTLQYSITFRKSTGAVLHHEEFSSVNQNGDSTQVIDVSPKAYKNKPTNKVTECNEVCQTKVTIKSDTTPTSLTQPVSGVKAKEENKAKTPHSNLLPRASILKATLLNCNDVNQQVAQENNIISEEAKVLKQRKVKHDNPEGKSKKCKATEIVRVERNKRKIDYDIRKAPELNNQVETKVSLDDTTSDTTKQHKVAIKIKLCLICSMHHLQDLCPLQNPHHISDAMTIREWRDCYQQTYTKNLKTDSDKENGDCTNNSYLLSFSYLSLPLCLFIKDCNTPHGLGVFAREDIKCYSQFGPLVGRIVKEVDIPEDFNMKNLWEVYNDKVHTFINTESLEESNWIRYVRPAPSRDERNIAVVCKSDELFITSVRDIQKGEELLYWQDNLITTNKKKMEKTSKS